MRTRALSGSLGTLLSERACFPTFIMRYLLRYPHSKLYHALFCTLQSDLPHLQMAHRSATNGPPVY